MIPTKLIQYRLCARSRAVRLALAEAGVEVELLEEQPWQYRQQFLAKNPAGELPVLEFPNGSTLCGAYAITEYLAEVAAVVAPATTGPSARRMELLPGTAEERAEIRRLIDWFNGKLDREVTREILTEKVYQRLHPTEPKSPDPDILRAVRANLRYHLAYVSYLAEARRWLAGEHVSLADLTAAAHLSVLDYLGEIPWGDYAAAKLWYARVKSRPSFRPLLADRIPGAAPPLHYTDLDF